MGRVDKVSRKCAVPVYILGLIALLIFQGGYFEVPSLAVAVVFLALSISLLHRTRKANPLLACFPLILPLLAIASAAFSGYGTYSLIKTAPYFVFAAAFMVIDLLDAKEKASILATVRVIGLVSSAISLLWLVFAPQVAGYVSGGRLQAFFQYANAAAVWYAVTALLLIGSRVRWQQIAAALPVVALLATRSVSVIVLFLICAMLWLFKSGEVEKTMAAAISISLCLIVGCFGILFSDRVLEASQTLIERVIQWGDALKLLGPSPVIGIGPGVWRYAYPAVQSAQYTARVVHSALFEAALDTGILGLACMVGLLFPRFKRLVSSARENGSFLTPLLCVVLMLVHALMDIDFTFGFFDLLFPCLLLQGDAAEEIPEALPVRSSRAPALIGCASLLLAAALLSLAAVRMVTIDRGDLPTGPLSRDVEVRYNNVLRLCDEGDYRLAISVAEGTSPATSEIAVTKAGANYRLGNNAGGESILLETLEKEPFNQNLYKTSTAYFSEYGLSDAGSKRLADFKNEVNRRIQEFPASLLNTQQSY